MSELVHSNERSRTTYDFTDVVQGFERSLSNSKLQNYCLDQIEEHKYSDTNVINSQNADFSLTVMENEQSNFDKILEQQEDKDIINQDDNIFKFLVSEQYLKKMITKTICSICNVELTLLRKKHQCKFCGDVVCGDHGRKKRFDPQDKLQFHRICDVCEDKYIKFSVQENYIRKRLDLNNKLVDLEKQSQQISQQIRKKQDLLQEQKSLMQSEQNNIKNKQNELNFKIQKINQENIQIRRDISALEDRTRILDTQIATVIEKIALKKQSINTKLSTKNDDLTNKMKAVDQDIKQIQFLIEQTNSKISEAKSAQEQRRNMSEQMLNDPQNNNKYEIYQQPLAKEEVFKQKIKPRKALKKIDENIGENEACQKCIIF